MAPHTCRIKHSQERAMSQEPEAVVRAFFAELVLAEV
jgi:hypothetical protein